jgi:hypothetical protein
MKFKNKSETLKTVENGSFKISLAKYLTQSTTQPFTFKFSTKGMKPCEPGQKISESENCEWLEEF